MKDGSLRLRRRHQLIALGFHAELREPVLLDELVAERVDERRARPDEGAAPARVLREHRAQRLVLPRADVGLAPGGLPAVVLVGAKLLRRDVLLLPLHRRAAAEEREGEERGTNAVFDCAFALELPLLDGYPCTGDSRERWRSSTLRRRGAIRRSTASPRSPCCRSTASASPRNGPRSSIPAPPSPRRSRRLPASARRWSSARRASASSRRSFTSGSPDGCSSPTTHASTTGSCGASSIAPG